VLTLPGTALVERVPLWLTVLIISRDVVIVLTVAIVNLAIGRRTFSPSPLGKLTTAVYIITGLLFMVFNYVGRRSMLLDVCVFVSLVVTIASSLDYMLHAARIINAPEPKG
jgi:cardiolipin synthase (CMP-forming)